MEPATQDLLAQFASDKNQRTLLVSRVEHRGGAGNDDDEDKPEPSPRKDETGKTGETDTVEFSLKILYNGGEAHTIAFLKREAYANLELRGDETTDVVANKLQLINLGYAGEDFNLFELAATYVDYSLIPLFNSFKTSKSQKADTGSAAGFDNI